MKTIIILLGIVFSTSLTGCRNPTSPAQVPNNIPSTTEFEISNFYSPLYHDEYNPGSTIKIRWENINNVDKVTIELFRKTTYQRTIASNKTDNGKFDWHTPSDITHSRHYRIKIKNSRDENQSITSEDFYIGN